MVIFKRRPKRDYHLNTQQIRLYVCIGTAALLLFLAIFGLAGRSSARGQLRDTREQVAGLIQNEMNQVLSCYDSMSRKSNSAIADEILPAMQQHMYTAGKLNTVLVDCFGSKYSVLDAALYDDIESAVKEYADKIAMGQSTADAAASMTLCMSNLESMLRDRFGEDGLLLPRTALK